MAFALGPLAQASGHGVVELARIDSTNAEALRRARAGKSGPLWIVAREQTAGHGRRNRAWISPSGNLAASFLMRLAVPPAVAANLGFVAGLAVVQALATVASSGEGASCSTASFFLKWPNDVLAGEAKIAGILLESETMSADALTVAVGIGINIPSAPEGVAVPAAALAGLGVKADAGQVFTALAEAWADYLRRWDGGKGFADIRAAWLAHAAGPGRTISVVTSGTTHEGTFETIDEEGRLVLSRKDGTRLTVSAGDVYFGSAASAGAGG
jgi:BirA family biotin operon repressor/biotin-[acetyl-CoA-carboxylase] ligase